MIETATCRSCAQVKEHTFSRLRNPEKLYPVKVYIDANGHPWHGRQCYDCKQAEQWKWPDKRWPKRGK